MQLDRLEIAGFMHFNHPAVLDLREVPSGLVAIVGPNGEGKTRLLDAGPASIFGAGVANYAFPSREGTLASYATSRDAYMESLWRLNERTYQARVTVDSLRRNTKATLSEILADGSKRVLDDQDGNVTKFRESVSGIFPSKRQVLASAYAAQGRQGSFVGLDQKGRLELFSEMLALAHYAEMTETAKRCATAAEKVRAGLVATADILQRATSDEIVQVLTDRVALLETDLADHREERQTQRATLQSLELARAALAADAEAYAVAESKVSGLSASLAEITRALRNVDADERDASRAAERELADWHDKVERHKNTLYIEDRLSEDKCKKALVEIDARIAASQQLIKYGDAIRAAVTARKEREEASRTLRAEQQSKYEAVNALREELSALKIELSNVEGSKTALAVAEQQAKMIEMVPFGEKCADAACRFLSSAIQARDHSIPMLREDVAGEQELRDKRTAKMALADDLDRSLMTCSNALKHIDDAMAADTLASKEPELAVAEAHIETLRNRRLQAEEDRHYALAASKVGLGKMIYDGEMVETGIDMRLNERLEQLETRRRELNEEELKVAQALLAAHRDVGQHQEARTRLGMVDVSIASAQAQLLSAEAAVARTEAQEAEAVRMLSDVQHKRTEHANVSERLRQVDNEWLSWRTLTQALGRDGLPKLEIDAAGPAVADLTNQLLQVGYGTRFTVDLTTQVERADGKGMKEEFTITVFDNTFGHKLGDLSDLSGGERVMVEEALRAGILLFNNARQQQPIRTCWRDETTGALYPETVPLYVKMLRRMHEIGGFRHTLFITHSEEAALLADTVVSVRDGVPTVQ